ncbi:hypothetical protein BC830DRAFT_368573, partial [Chytriomyces sp. MP71]
TRTRHLFFLVQIANRKKTCRTTLSTNLTCEAIMPIKADPGSGGGGVSSNGAGGVFKKSRSPPTVVFNLTASSSDARTYDRTASASTSTTIITINASGPPNSARSVACISATSAQPIPKKRSGPLARNRPRMLSLRNFDRPDLSALLSGDEDCNIVSVGAAA